MKNKKKDLLLEQIDELRNIKLPAGWEVARLDVEFVKPGLLQEYSQVIYDARNGVFYARTNNSIIYPEEKKVTMEAIEIMEKANKIINKK